MIRSSRKIHKYLSLAISVQLLLWTISGIYFSFNKIEDVRGSQYLRTTEVVETPKGYKVEPQKALLIVAAKSLTSFTNQLCLVHGRVIPVVSHS